MLRVAFVLIGATVATLLAGCSAPTAPSNITIRLTRAMETAPADAPYLYLEGEITNQSSEPFSSGGCTRPRIEIDSLGASGSWGTIATNPQEDLVACFRAYTVDPGRTASFVAAIFRPGISVFPKNQRLRARIPVNDAGTGPTAEFVLPR